MWKKILNNEVSYPEGLLQGDPVKIQGMDMIKKILVKDVESRLGYGPDGYKKIKEHPFFKGIDWEKEVSIPLSIKSLSSASKAE